MAETFYSALGVDRDTDADAVRAAYRDLVKEHHPDVSEDPAAGRTFQRLTTARDVLVDAAERARYDRLGHEPYVRQHVETSVWSVPTAPASTADVDDGDRVDSTHADTRTAGDDGTRRACAHGRHSPDDPWWVGNRERAGGHGERRPGTGTASAHRDEPWQTASAAYRRSRAASDAAARQRGRSPWDVLRAVGPWLPVHLVLLCSAGATTWVWLGQVERLAGASLPAYLAGVGLVGLVALTSVLHLVSRVYA